MNQNSVIEIGSKANVILRFKGNVSLNGKDYVANEPYLFLKDVRVLINYSNQDKTARTDKTVLANSDAKPRNVAIGDIAFTRKIASLLSTFVSSEHPEDKTKFETGTASGGVLFLLEENVNDRDPIFVYDNDFNKVAGVTYNNILNALESVNFVDDAQYLSFYSSVVTGTKFDLNKTHIPYMSMEVQGLGNIDKVAKSVIMYFDKVSLNSVVDFTFMQNTMINVPLNFHIIDDVNNYVIYED